MEQLRDELEESVFLGVREGRGDVKVIAKAVSRAAIRYDSDDPDPRTAYCTGMGRILLAFWDKKSTAAYLMRNRLRAHTPRTVTDAAKLRAILAKVAADGYAVVEEEYVLGGSATAAPVFSANGTVVAALNVGTVSARYPAAKPRIIAGVVRAAATISQRLGYRRAASSFRRRVSAVSYQIGVDIGGTFADFCALDETTGRLATLKVLSTPQEPGREVIAGCRSSAAASASSRRTSAISRTARPSASIR